AFFHAVTAVQSLPCPASFCLPLCCHRQIRGSTLTFRSCVTPRKVNKGHHHPVLGIVIKCPLSGETQQERIMMSLAGKKIVLGVSGGIAAYKTPDLVRRLRERGADVRVAITEGGKAFITPLSL